MGVVTQVPGADFLSEIVHLFGILIGGLILVSVHFPGMVLFDLSFFSFTYFIF